MKLKRFNLSCSRNTSIQENRYKMLYRWHPTLAKLQIMYPQLDGKCWWCPVEKADYMHIWWHCIKKRVFLETSAFDNTSSIEEKGTLDSKSDAGSRF